VSTGALENTSAGALRKSTGTLNTSTGALQREWGALGEGQCLYSAVWNQHQRGVDNYR